MNKPIHDFTAHLQASGTAARTLFDDFGAHSIPPDTAPAHILYSVTALMRVIRDGLDNASPGDKVAAFDATATLVALASLAMEAGEQRFLEEKKA